MARALLQLQALALDPNNASTGTALMHLHGGVGGEGGGEAGSIEAPRSQGEENRSQYLQQQKYSDLSRQQVPQAGDRRRSLAARQSLDDGRGRSVLNTWIADNAASSSSLAAFAGESSETSARQRTQPPGGPQRSATARVRSSSATSGQSRPVLPPQQQAKRIELTQERGQQPASGT